jgi:hypothetical protein
MNNINMYKYQEHLFKIFNTAENKSAREDGKVYMPINTSGEAKMVKINFTYAFRSNVQSNLIVSCPELDGDIVGCLNNFSFEAGGGYYYADGFKANNAFTYVFPKPKVLNGNLTFVFLNTVTATITNNVIVSHVEVWY